MAEVIRPQFRPRWGQCRPRAGGAGRSALAGRGGAYWTGELATRAGIPGTVESHPIDDLMTGRTIEIEVGGLMSRISVDGRDYFSGRYGGSGFGLLLQIRPARHVGRRRPQSRPVMSKAAVFIGPSATRKSSKDAESAP